MSLTEDTKDAVGELDDRAAVEGNEKLLETVTDKLVLVGLTEVVAGELVDGETMHTSEVELFGKGTEPVQRFLGRFSSL